MREMRILHLVDHVSQNVLKIENLGYREIYFTVFDSGVRVRNNWSCLYRLFHFYSCSNPSSPPKKARGDRYLLIFNFQDYQRLDLKISDSF